MQIHPSFLIIFQFHLHQKGKSAADRQKKTTTLTILNTFEARFTACSFPEKNWKQTNIKSELQYALNICSGEH